MIHLFRLLSFIGLTTCLTQANLAATFCSTPSTTTCLYEPPVTYSFITTTNQTLSYPDITGTQRSFDIILRIPQGAPEPMPVVIWSHGGAGGKTDPANSLPEWSDASAAAGYLTVSIAHPGRPDSGVAGSREDLCLALGYTDGMGNLDTEICDNFKHLNWDRPFDILQVLLELQTKAQLPAWSNRIDLDNIAIGGHSAGSGGALTVGGAVRDLHGFILDFPLYVASNYPQLANYPTPKAILAFSPQSSGSEGFFETDFQQPDTSWDNLDLPVLIASGDGDNGCNDRAACERDSTPSGRRAVFDLLPGTGKFRLYINNSDAYHMIFALSRNRCDPAGPVDAVSCDDFVQWLQSAALAFLDSNLKALPGATDWLESENLVNGADLTQPGVVEWDHK